MPNPLAADLDHILTHTADLWPNLRGARIFITGGTGFFGCWILESFAWASDRLDFGAKAVVLTRDAAAFRQKAPHLSTHPAIQLYSGDVRTYDFPPGEFSHVIHAATESSSGLNERDSLQMLDSIIAGTRHTLDFAVAKKAAKFLLTSSGAVYGAQPPNISHVSESHTGAPDVMNPRAAYAEGKRVAELLCAIYNQRHGIETKIARCFAFVGPYLPLNAHFAIGNFIRDAIEQQPIVVQGDGTPYRSYLYAADLAIWLWTILERGEPCRPYNVGSEQDLTIADLAQACADGQRIRILRSAPAGQPRQAYVPSTERARTELGLNQHISLPESIHRTREFVLEPVR